MRFECLLIKILKNHFVYAIKKRKMKLFVINLFLVFSLVIVQINSQAVDPSSSTESPSSSSTESTSSSTTSSTTPSTTSSTTPSTTSSTTPSTTSSTTPSTTSSTTTTTTTPAPPFTCPAAGVYADADCKKYHRCTASLVDYVYTCPGTSYFNEMTMKCSTTLSPKCKAQATSTTTPATKKSKGRYDFSNRRFLENKRKSSKSDEGKNQWMKMFQGTGENGLAKGGENQKFSKDDLKEKFLGKYQKTDEGINDEDNENSERNNGFSIDSLKEKYLGNFGKKEGKNKFSKDQLGKKYQKNDEGTIDENNEDSNANKERNNGFSKDGLKEKYLGNFGKKEGGNKFSKDQLEQFFPAFEQLG